MNIKNEIFSLSLIQEGLWDSTAVCHELLYLSDTSVCSCTALWPWFFSSLINPSRFQRSGRLITLLSRACQSLTPPQPFSAGHAWPGTGPRELPAVASQWPQPPIPRPHPSSSLPTTRTPSLHHTYGHTWKGLCLRDFKPPNWPPACRLKSFSPGPLTPAEPITLPTLTFSPLSFPKLRSNARPYSLCFVATATYSSWPPTWPFSWGSVLSSPNHSQKEAKIKGN